MPIVLKLTLFTNNGDWRRSFFGYLLKDIRIFTISFVISGRNQPLQIFRSLQDLLLMSMEKEKTQLHKRDNSMQNLE